MTVCTVKRNPLEFANLLHKNLQFTLETPNGSGDLTFLYLKINVNEDRESSCHWYQKLTDTDRTLNSYSCSPLQHKKGNQGTVVVVVVVVVGESLGSEPSGVEPFSFRLARVFSLVCRFHSCIEVSRCSCRVRCSFCGNSFGTSLSEVSSSLASPLSY